MSRTRVRTAGLGFMLCLTGEGAPVAVSAARKPTVSDASNSCDCRRWFSWFAVSTATCSAASEMPWVVRKKAGTRRLRALSVGVLASIVGCIVRQNTNANSARTATITDKKASSAESAFDCNNSSSVSGAWVRGGSSELPRLPSDNEVA